MPSSLPEATGTLQEGCAWRRAPEMHVLGEQALAYCWGGNSEYAFSYFGATPGFGGAVAIQDLSFSGL